MALNVFEVLFGFSRCGCAQSLVVLDFAALNSAIAPLLDPMVVVRDREKALGGGATCHFDDWCDKLLKETWNFQKTWPEMVQKVDQQTFDVGAVMVLICHDHDRAIPEVIDISVGLTHVEAHDLDQILQLLVSQYLVG